MAFPAIATGVYGCPPDQAADVAIHTIRTTPSSVELIRLIAFDEDTMSSILSCCGQTD
jgi:O-acetyl-ADP-ribose deacetylase (regulator of RNase III)